MEREVFASMQIFKGIFLSLRAESIEFFQRSSPSVESAHERPDSC